MELKRQIFFAYRSLKANRLCSVIGMVGLAIGLACILVIVKYVWQEYTTDKFHKEYERIYACVSTASDRDVPELSEIINCRDRIGDYPEVKAHTAVGIFAGEIITVNDRPIKTDVLFTDSHFFEVFTFPLLLGDTATVLKQVTDVVVTESFARKVFGEQYPLGKEIPYWNQIYKVTGVLKDIPINSSFSFDMLILERPDFYRMKAEFILLHQKSGIREIEKRLTDDKFFGAQHYFYHFIPLVELYFNRGIATSVLDTLRRGNIHSLIILLLAGLIVLIISMVNYINIYQVALLKRDKELGIKKVHGVSNRTLWSGFWIENLLLVVGAVGLALVFLVCTSGWIENKLGIPLRLNLGFDLMVCGGAILLLPLFAAIGPFWKYSHIRPAMAIKGSGSGKHIVAVRHLLLGIQYVMTMMMLIVSFYFIKQLHFMQQKDIGLNRENIMLAMLFKEPKVERYWGEDEQEREEMMERTQAILNKHEDKIAYIENEIRKYPYIQHACAGVSWLDYNLMPWKSAQGDMDYISCALADVDPEFKQLYGLQLIEGRFFDKYLDRGREEKVVLNETAMKKLGIENIKEAELISNAWGRGWKVIGVVKDFRFTHLSTPVLPLVLIYFGDKDNRPYHFHITEGKEQEVLTFLRKLYTVMETPGEFEYVFFEDKIEELYAKDKKVVAIATLFTLLAIGISSVGLFGFAYFDARQRYREIGVRKVNGATTAEVLFLLIRRFLLLIGCAFVIAIPIAILIIRKYMENYSECTPLSGWIFVIALLLTAGVAFCTLLWQSRKAAGTNPVEVLKGE